MDRQAGPAEREMHRLTGPADPREHRQAGRVQSSPASDWGAMMARWRWRKIPFMLVNVNIFTSGEDVHRTEALRFRSLEK